MIVCRLGLERGRYASLSHLLEALADVLDARCQAVGRKAFLLRFFGNLADDSGCCALRGVERFTRSVCRAAPNIIAGLAHEIIFDLQFRQSARDQPSDHHSKTRSQQGIFVYRIEELASGLCSCLSQLSGSFADVFATRIEGITC